MSHPRTGSVVTRRMAIAAGSALIGSMSSVLQSAPRYSRKSNMSVVDTLIERNREFVRTRFSPDLKIMPSLRTIIIGCVDPRVDPAEILALAPGEAAIIRNVGGRVYPSTVQTMDMLSEVSKASGGLLGAGWNLVLLHHTDCGINRLNHAEEMLAGHFGVTPAKLADLAVTHPTASIAVDIALLKADPRLSGDIVVSGLVYDVKTGMTATVAPPEALRPKNAA
jgi:carbonic anhydrase